MAKAERKDFTSPDDVRTFEKDRMELVKIGGGVVGRLTLESGWQWSQHVKPMAKTQWCEASHLQYQVSGRLHVVMADGTEFETGPGQVVTLPSGHDGWVVGEEAVVVIDWAGARHYARQHKNPVDSSPRRKARRSGAKSRSRSIVRRKKR